MFLCFLVLTLEESELLRVSSIFSTHSVHVEQASARAYHWRLRAQVVTSHVLGLVLSLPIS